MTLHVNQSDDNLTDADVSALLSPLSIPAGSSSQCGLSEAESLIALERFAEAWALLDSMLSDPESDDFVREGASFLLERALTAEFTPLLDTRHMAGSRTEFRLTCSLLAWQMRHSQIIAPLVDDEKVTSVSELQDEDSGILCRCRIEERPALACFDFFAEGCVLDMPLNPAISSWINRINRILPSGCLIFDVDSGELHLQAKYCFVDALCLPQHWEAFWKTNICVMQQVLPSLRRACRGEDGWGDLPELTLAADKQSIPPPTEVLLQAQQQFHLFESITVAPNADHVIAPIEHEVRTEWGYCGPVRRWTGEFIAQNSPPWIEMQLRWQQLIPSDKFASVLEWVNRRNSDSGLGNLCLDETTGKLLIKQSLPVSGAILLPSHIQSLVRRTFAMFFMVPSAGQMDELESMLNGGALEGEQHAGGH